MHLEGARTLNSLPEDVWKILLDPEVLARVTPGIKRLESLGENKYDTISEIKLGPVNGAFKGKMEVTDLVEPESFTLKMRMNSKIGNVSAECKISLKTQSASQTEVVFSGDAKLSGPLARFGQRVLGGVADSMVNQFFKSLEQELG